uniref:uncharacterized protein LOC120344933 n=1 Tax=Styela clava TaxID=7725 RepID=UPI00193983BC|nr:uncharacterized protein LOC120344933 [Styela clava]
MEELNMSSCCNQQPQESFSSSEHNTVVRCDNHFRRCNSGEAVWKEHKLRNGHAVNYNYGIYARKTKLCRGTYVKCLSKFHVTNFLSMSEQGSLSLCRRAAGHVFLGPNPNCARDTPKDNVCTYAKSTRKYVSSSMPICVLLCFFLLRSVSSQTTVTNGCPNRCLCVFGEDNHQLMNILLENENQIGAWERIKTKPDHVNIYFCTRSGFSTVPKGLPAEIEALFLDGNKISQLNSLDFVADRDDVETSSPITVLSFANNTIHSISNDAFRSLKHLRLLILKENYLQNLQWTLGLTMYHELLEMDLSSNNIKYFRLNEAGFFPVLKRLDLSRNEILSIEGNVLANFPKLEHLDLSSNQITSGGLSPSDSFVYSLKSLLLSNNDISLDSVKDTEFFNRFGQLRYLDISKNKISRGVLSSKTFAGLEDLRELNLSSCDIKKLEQGWINGGPEKNIKVLDLSHNVLSKISAHALSAVFTLDLNVTPSYEGNATAKQSETIDEAMLDFMEIPRENVEPHWLRPLPLLNTLYLNGNPHLNYIEDDTFDYLPNLQYLFLQNCGIRRLNIASARYRYGTLPISTTLPRLSHIWVHGNPLECDCYIRFLKEWSVTVVTVNGNQSSGKHIDPPSYTINSQTKQIEVELAVCASPANMAGLTIANAQGQGMTCQDEPYSIFIAVLIGPLTFAGSVLLTMICGSFHVCFVKMKKGAVLSYHAREEMMRNPKVRGRRRNVPPNIFSSFGWTAPLPQDDISTYSPGSRTGRYTNLVLGQLGEHRSHPTVSAGILSHTMALGHSTTNLTVEDAPHYKKKVDENIKDTDEIRKRSGTPLLVVRGGRYNESGNNDYGTGHSSVATRSASHDIPFIDEKGHLSSCPQSQSLEDMRRNSFSEEIDRRQLPSHKREHSLTTLSSSDPEGHSGSPSDGSIQSPVSIHAIPEPSGSSHGSSEEVCL